MDIVFLENKAKERIPVWKEALIKASTSTETVRQQLEHDAQSPNVNEQTLLRILSLAKATAFGKAHSFSTITDARGFVKAFPKVLEYSDYSQYINKIIQGDQDVLFPGRPLLYFRSAGTTGEAKYIPKHELSLFLRPYLLMSSVLNPHLPSPPIMITLLARRLSPTAPDGLSCSPYTSELVNVFTAMKTFAPRPKWDVPIEVTEQDIRPHAVYLHVLAALLQSDLVALGGYFITNVLLLFQVLESHWDELLEDVRLGTCKRLLDTASNASSSVMLSYFGQHPPDYLHNRALQLAAARNSGWKEIAGRLWPQLKMVIATCGGSFTIYEDRLRRYLPNSIRLYAPFYGSTEAIFGYNLWPNLHQDRYVLDPRQVFFEFLPYSAPSQLPQQDDGRSAATQKRLTLYELQSGHQYVVIITTFEGLYAYNMNDIVEVVDHMGVLPVVRLCGRVSAELSIVGERVPEALLRSVIKSVCARFGASLHDYTVYPNFSNGRCPFYEIFLETEGDLTSEPSLLIASEIDKDARAACGTYSFHREVGALAQPAVSFLRRGTFGDFLSSDYQRKVPRLLSKPDDITYVRANLMQGEKRHGNDK